MAEFKLGRIKFVWQGEWVTAKAYVKDDIIRYGGQVYICVQAHTAGPDFYLDSAYWNVMSDGQNWVGNWDINTYYKKGDVVKYGGLLYVANNGHTSAGTITLGLKQKKVARLSLCPLVRSMMRTIKSKNIPMVKKMVQLNHLAVI